MSFKQFNFFYIIVSRWFLYSFSNKRFWSVLHNRLPSVQIEISYTSSGRWHKNNLFCIQMDLKNLLYFYLTNAPL